MQRSLTVGNGTFPTARIHLSMTEQWKQDELFEHVAWQPGQKRAGTKLGYAQHFLHCSSGGEHWRGKREKERETSTMIDERQRHVHLPPLPGMRIRPSNCANRAALRRISCFLPVPGQKHDNIINHDAPAEDRVGSTYHTHKPTHPVTHHG
jgi:hypothetical protein